MNYFLTPLPLKVIGGLVLGVSMFVSILGPRTLDNSHMVVSIYPFKQLHVVVFRFY